VKPPTSGENGNGGEVKPPTSGENGNSGEVKPPTGGENGNGGEVKPPTVEKKVPENMNSQKDKNITNK
ncbi:hypothetical protein, partial [Bacillus cereus]